jgi:two-component system response regulator HydG
MKRILLIDDDVDLLDILSESLDFLIKEPKQITSISNSETAMELISKNTYDTVITDYRMPNFSGKDIIEQSLKYKINQVILISGENPNLEKYTTVRFYPKPINFESFLKEIETK